MGSFVFYLPPMLTGTTTPVEFLVDPADGTWAGYPLLNLVPEVYQTLDAEVNGNFINFLSAFLPIWDFYREKIRDLGDLRDPLKAPVDTSFNREVIILKVEDLGDGTSRVFLSQGASGDRFNDLRPGMVLTDSSGTRFDIIGINSSGLPSEFNNPPIDPYTGNATGRHIVVRNISLAELEQIPAVSGYLIQNEDPTPTPIDDGVNQGPYSLTVEWAPIARNLVTVSWTEGGEPKVGYFYNDGRFAGQLAVGSSIDFDTGSIIIDTANKIAVDNDSIRVTYTTQQILRENPTPTPLDDGVQTGPYDFKVKFPPLALHQVTVEWEESSVAKKGVFSSAGVSSGDLDASSTINFVTGEISLVNVGGAAIDADTIRVSYLSEIVLPPVDAVINAQHILAFLAADYGVTLDRHDPEFLQRSYVYHAYQLWDLKGTAQGYEILGKMAGFIVRPKRLYKVSAGMIDTLSLPLLTYYEYAGLSYEDEDPLVGNDSHIIPPPDGASVGPFEILVSNPAIYSSSNIVLKWTNGLIAKTAILTPANAVTGNDAADIVAFTADRMAGKVSVEFQPTKEPDPGSVRISYTQADFYTDLDPGAAIIDEVALDATPLDSYCFESEDVLPGAEHYPTVYQVVSVSSITAVKVEGNKTRYQVVVDATGRMHESLGTHGTFQDAALNLFSVEKFERIDSFSYQFEVLSAVAPTAGGGVVKWQAVKQVPSLMYETPGTVTGSSILPSNNGLNLGPFNIQLAHYPLNPSSALVVAWTSLATPKYVFVEGPTGGTLSGPDVADISNLTLDRTLGQLSITFTSPPDASSLMIGYFPDADLYISGIGSDVVDLGIQYLGYTGIRYRLTASFLEPIAIGSVGQWKIVDAEGKQGWIEQLRHITDTPSFQYEIDFIMDGTPAVGPANIFYVCNLHSNCSYCAASAIRLTLEADVIKNYPEIDVNEAANRLIERLRELIPAHVRIADFDLIV